MRRQRLCAARLIRRGSRGRLIVRVSSRWLVLLTVVSTALLSLILQAGPALSATEKRIALVIGNAAYQAGALATPANDAGLVAQTLQAAGFDVVGARDLDEDALRRAMRDFTDKAAASGPDTVAFVYLAGYGVQLNGENYFAPVDAQIARAADVPVRALRLSDYKRQLAAIPLKARFVVLDAGRSTPFVKSGDPLAGGLALTEAEPGSLVAFNAAPGTIGPQEKGPYGAYAQALVEMIREGGLEPAELFDRVRLRVSEATQGGEVPWSVSRIEGSFAFFMRAADAPPIADPARVAALGKRPLSEIGVQDAYAACLQRDTMQSYEDFVSAYPRDVLAKRVRVLIAARREALTWQRTALADTPDAYWSYLRRYPRGPHGWDARRRLRELAVALEPPPHFAMLAYDVPPPPPEEIVYVERPVVFFADPYYDLPPPPPPPAFFLPPPPAYIVDLAPPPPVTIAYALPAPAFVPIPTYVVAPAYIAPPPNNVYFTNIHNTTVINEINQQTIRFSQERRGASPLAVGAGAVAGAAAGAAIARVALPPALQQRAAAPANPTPNGPAGADARLNRGILPGPGQPPMVPPNGIQQATRPGQPGPLNPPQQQGSAPNARGALGQPLPGQNGQPLPQQANRPGQPTPTGAPSARPGQPPLPQQAARPGGPQPDPAVRLPQGNGPVPPAPAAARNAAPDPIARPNARPSGNAPGASAQQAVQQRQQLQQQRLQADQQRAAIQQQQQASRQQQQAVQQRAAAQQQQRQAMQQAAAAQQRQMMQQANQQRAAAAQQQQRQAMQQQMAQQRQMQAQQRQQAMARPQPAPRGGGRPPCPPGAHCR